MDRGKDWRKRVEVALGARVHLTSPHHPWQQETNENTNSPLRENFPKGTAFADVSDDEAATAYDALNRKPRKRLEFRTPLEVHCSEVLHLL